MKWRVAGDKGKYGNKRATCSCGGRTFQSRKEARRFPELILLESQGIIRQLCLQVPFELEGGVFYIADYVYQETDTMVWIVEDVKGMKTATYKLKKKQFLARHPYVKFLES